MKVSEFIGDFFRAAGDSADIVCLYVKTSCKIPNQTTSNAYIKPFVRQYAIFYNSYIKYNILYIEPKYYIKDTMQ